MKIKKILLVLGVLCTFSGAGYSQNTNRILNFYSGQNQINYFQPLADILITSVNSGFTDRMPLDDKFHIGIKVVGSAIFLPGVSQKSFSPVNENGEVQSFTVPTIIGDPNAVIQEKENGLADTYLPGTGSRYLPLIAPQLNIGNVFGTSIGIRFLPYNLKSEGEKFSWIGVGVNHNVGRYFLKDSSSFLVAQFAYQKLNISNYFDFSTSRVSVNYGKQMEKFQWYAFVGYQTGNLDADFDIENNNDEQENFMLSLQNNNKIVGGLGAGLKLGAFAMNSELNLLQPTVLSLSIGLSL